MVWINNGIIFLYVFHDWLSIENMSVLYLNESLSSVMYLKTFRGLIYNQNDRYCMTDLGDRIFPLVYLNFKSK
jgi:hypothetical protein